MDATTDTKGINHSAKEAPLATGSTDYKELAKQEAELRNELDKLTQSLEREKAPISFSSSETEFVFEIPGDYPLRVQVYLPNIHFNVSKLGGNEPTETQKRAMELEKKREELEPQYELLNEKKEDIIASFPPIDKKNQTSSVDLAFQIKQRFYTDHPELQIFEENVDELEKVFETEKEKINETKTKIIKTAMQREIAERKFLYPDEDPTPTVDVLLKLIAFLEEIIPKDVEIDDRWKSANDTINKWYLDGPQQVLAKLVGENYSPTGYRDLFPREFKKKLGIG